MQVNFLDIQAQHPLIKEEIRNKFDEIIADGNFVGLDGSKHLTGLEMLFSSFCGTEYAVAVNSGTSALWMILYALGIGPGDEVIIPANTFIATAEAVTLVGALPVFVDIMSDGYLIDSAAIISKITPQTKAIIPVHMYGQCADMDPILEIAKSHKLFVVEDACQAHGAIYKGRKAGSMGTAAAFSFYAGKNLGAWGDGGAITTNDALLANKLRAIRNHGSLRRYIHDIVGGNFRLDEFQSAVLSTKMKHIEFWNECRRKNADRYRNLLSGNELIILPKNDISTTSVWHLFVIRIKNRDDFMNFLRSNNVQTAIHYPTPLHLTNAYSNLGYVQGDFPVCELIQSEIVSLPMYAELTEAEIKYVCDKINDYSLQGEKLNHV